MCPGGLVCVDKKCEDGKTNQVPGICQSRRQQYLKSAVAMFRPMPVVFPCQWQNGLVRQHSFRSCIHDNAKIFNGMRGRKKERPSMTTLFQVSNTYRCRHVQRRQDLTSEVITIPLLRLVFLRQGVLRELELGAGALHSPTFPCGMSSQILTLVAV